MNQPINYADYAHFTESADLRSVDKRQARRLKRNGWTTLGPTLAKGHSVWVSPRWYGWRTGCRS